MPHHSHPRHGRHHHHDDDHAESGQSLRGTFIQPIFSPRGGLEGLLLSVDGETAQVVIDPEHDASVFASIKSGQLLVLDVSKQGPSPKGEAVHAVYQFHALLTVDGKAVVEAPDKFIGTVQRLNYAKHGEPNGVVLDSGDFIHLRPDGFRTAALSIGDRVTAEGASLPMFGGGRVVEATRVNGVKIEGKKPKPPKHGPEHHDKRWAERHL